MNLLCKIFGHVPCNINRDKFTATCKRCGKSLKVCYDMCYGDTIVEGVKYKATGFDVRTEKFKF